MINHRYFSRHYKAHAIKIVGNQKDHINYNTAIKGHATLPVIPMTGLCDADLSNVNNYIARNNILNNSSSGSFCTDKLTSIKLSLVALKSSELRTEI